MKKFISVIFSFIALAGCKMFPVTVSDDPFRGVTVVTADMWHSVVDRRIDNLRVLYSKTISNGSLSDPTVRFEFVANNDPYYNDYHGEKLGPEAYILTDNKSFTVKLIDSSLIPRKIPIVSSYGFGFFHPFYREIIIGTSEQYTILAKIQLTPEISQAILGAGRYMIRFYTGDTPLTLQATKRQLDSVKTFLLKGAPAPDVK